MTEPAGTPGESSERHATPWKRMAILGVAVVTLFVVWVVFHDSLPSPNEIRAEVEHYGWWIVLAALPLIVGLKIAVFPSSVLSITAGLVFGVAVGTAVVVVASTIAACIQLAVSRRMGGEELRSRIPDKLHRYDRFIERKGWLAIATLRLLPISHNLMNYATGMTSLHMRHMAIGTAIGSIPMAFAYAELGGHAHELGSWQIKLGIGMLLALAVGGAFLMRHNVGADADEGPHPAVPSH